MEEWLKFCETLRVLFRYNVPKDIRKVIFDLVFWAPFLLFLQERFRQCTILRRRALVTRQNGVGWEIIFNVARCERVVTLTPFLIQSTLVDFNVGQIREIQLPYILTQGSLYCYLIQKDYRTFVEKAVGVKYNPGYFASSEPHFGWSRFFSQEFLTPLGVREQEIEKKSAMLLHGISPDATFNECTTCYRSNATNVVVKKTDASAYSHVIYLQFCDTCFKDGLRKFEQYNRELTDEWQFN
jgi:hypothetical protein